MTSLPPSIPPWSQAPPSTGPAPQPTLGAAPQPSAFTNPIVGTVSSSPGGIPASVQSLFPNAAKNRRSLREAPLSVLAVVSALVGQATLVIVAVAFMAVAGGVAKVASDFQSEFGTSSSGTSDGEIMLVVGSMILFVFAVSIIAVALKLYGGSWKAWFGAVGLQGFFLLVGLYMVIEASGTWVLGLIGPVIIAGMLMLPDARTWVATESSPT